MNKISAFVVEDQAESFAHLAYIAHSYSKERGKIYFYSEDSSTYKDFCKCYSDYFRDTCPVIRLNKSTITEDDLVLVDNVFDTNIFMGEILFFQRQSKKLCITIYGESHIDIPEDTYNEVEQLTFDTMEMY